MNQDYQEVDLIELINKVIKFWWLVALLAIVAGATAYYLTTNYITPIYEARTTLFIGRETGALEGLSIGDLTLADKLVTDYSELIKSNLVLNQVIEDLGINATPNMLRGKIKVSTLSDSRFIDVAVKDPSPEMARAMADSVSKILKLEAEEIVGVKNVTFVDNATLPRAPISPSVTRNVAVAVVIGVLLALIFILITTMLNNKIEKEEDIEKNVGLPVIGVIPKFKGDLR